MSPKQVQNLAEQTPWDLKAREQSLWFDALPLDPPRVVLPQKLCQPETPTSGFARKWSLPKGSRWSQESLPWLWLEAIWPVETKAVPFSLTSLFETLISKLPSGSFFLVLKNSLYSNWIALWSRPVKSKTSISHAFSFFVIWTGWQFSGSFLLNNHQFTSLFSRFAMQAVRRNQAAPSTLGVGISSTRYPFSSLESSYLPQNTRIWTQFSQVFGTV